MPQLNRLDELVKKQAEQRNRLLRSDQLKERSRVHAVFGNMILSKKLRKLLITSPFQLLLMKIGILLALFLDCYILLMR